MPNVTAGMAGNDVAVVQRWMMAVARSQKIPIPPGFGITGSYDTYSVSLMKAIQKKFNLAQTGNWNQYTQALADKIAPWMGSKTRFGWVPSARNIGDDRKYVIDQFNYLFGRPPTATELAHRVSQLQAGMTRTQWMAGMEKHDTQASVTRIYKQMFGRDPTPAELSNWSSQLKNGQATRESMSDYLKTTHEFLTKKEQEALTPDAEDQQAALEEILDEYGLGDLKQWAWDQIKSGVSNTRILQELRQTDQYKARFPGMAAMGGPGQPAMTESQYLQYEQDFREIARRFGLPPGFYDDPNDFAALIGAGVSIDELQSRIQEGYARVMNAPIEIRQAFSAMYGMDGDAALATLFIDPDRGEQALLKQARAAEAKGWGGLFGVDFSTEEAESLAGIELETDALRQGLQELGGLRPLFQESVSEDEDMRIGKEGVEAVFATGGTGAVDLDERRRQRIAATSGGGGANISQTGLGVGSAD